MSFGSTRSRPSLRHLTGVNCSSKEIRVPSFLRLLDELCISRDTVSFLPRISSTSGNFECSWNTRYVAIGRVLSTVIVVPYVLRHSRYVYRADTGRKMERERESEGGREGGGREKGKKRERENVYEDEELAQRQ